MKDSNPSCENMSSSNNNSSINDSIMFLKKQKDQLSAKKTNAVTKQSQNIPSAKRFSLDNRNLIPSRFGKSENNISEFPSSTNRLGLMKNDNHTIQSPPSHWTSVKKALERRRDLQNSMDSSLYNEIESKLLPCVRADSDSSKHSNDSEEELKAVQRNEDSNEGRIKKYILERVFWTKEKMSRIRRQLRTAKVKIYEKTKKDFDQIDAYIALKDRTALMYNDNKFRRKLLVPAFKSFYPKELHYKKILVKLLEGDLTDVLLDLLKDEFYTFDKRYVITLIEECLAPNKRGDKE
jgi:hypothetical protein